MKAPFDPSQAYLKLLKAALSHALYQPASEATFSGDELKRADQVLTRVRRRFAKEVQEIKAGARPVTPALLALLTEFAGQDVARFLRINAPQAHTLLTPDALDNIHACARQVIFFDIPGDFMECGVWRGGACILMRGLQLALGAGHRQVWVADSFQGLPSPDPQKHLLDAVIHEYLKDTGNFCVDLDQVRDNFSRYDLLDEGVRFLPGWFHDTLPGFEGQLALLRLDGDWYESTLTALECLYDKVSLGGYIIIDDYHPVVGAYAAVNEFRARRQITDPLTQVNHQLHFWRKLD